MPSDPSHDQHHQRIPPRAWPAHTSEVRPWAQRNRSGPREDRMFHEVVTSMPPHISTRTVPLDSDVVVESEMALREIVALDRIHAEHLEPLSALLLRTESVASSKIEQIFASTDDYARAGHGVKANPSAVSMVAATKALDFLIRRATEGDGIDVAAITSAHSLLMADDQHEAREAGRFRDVQNWIGGSDHSPRAADYVPPPPETVEPYMDDLVAFASRDDIPVLAQAAIVHAQFESIHPFTDGNGRIGRALVNAVLRQRTMTTKVVVPLASALVADRERYFGLLDAYRAGDHQSIVSAFAEASRTAAEESRRTAEHLAAVPDEWRAVLGPVRSDSAAARLLNMLPTTPAFSTADAYDAIDASESSVYAAIERLHDAGVIRPLTDRVRNQVWGAPLILDELDDLSLRIEHTTRSGTGSARSGSTVR